MSIVDDDDRPDGPPEYVVPEDPCTVGAVWYTSWGYDQTNSEFFEVIEVKPASVVIKRIAATLYEGRLYPRPGVGCVDWHLRGNATRWNEKSKQSEPNPSFERDEARGYSTKLCRKPRDRGAGRASLVIDNVRSAWPYTGGGQYDTLAAGHPGH